MATEIDAARLLTYRAAWLAQQGRTFTKEAAMAKLFASEAANRAAYKATADLRRLWLHEGICRRAIFSATRGSRLSMKAPLRFNAWSSRASLIHGEEIAHEVS